MVARRKLYEPIDIHARAKAVTWPESIPKMTDADAVNAASRLFRWATGSTFQGEIWITTGNRSAFRIGWKWKNGKRAIFVNPSKGWREFAHDASHYIDHYVNGNSNHDSHHARFEKNLIAQIVRRGWLDPKPTPEPNVVPIDPPGARQRREIARIDARIKKWETKAKRAKTALAKLSRSRKAYERSLAKITA